MTDPAAQSMPHTGPLTASAFYEITNPAVIGREKSAFTAVKIGGDFGEDHCWSARLGLSFVSLTGKNNLSAKRGGARDMSARQANQQLTVQELKQSIRRP